MELKDFIKAAITDITDAISELQNSTKVNAGNESRLEKVSRISFSIPVIYPTAEVKTYRELRDESAKRKLQELRTKDRSSVSVEVSQEGK